MFLFSGQTNNKLMYIAVLVLGSLILAMPKEGDFSEYFPRVFPRPTSEMKFMITFCLGKELKSFET